MANVINTIKADEFGKWVHKKVNERNEARQAQQDTTQMDPEIKRFFEASTATSGEFLYF